MKYKFYDYKIICYFRLQFVFEIVDSKCSKESWNITIFDETGKTTNTAKDLHSVVKKIKHTKMLMMNPLILIVYIWLYVVGKFPAISDSTQVTNITETYKFVYLENC